MKKLMSLFALLFIFASCSLESDSPVLLEPVGEWKLVKTTGQDGGSERTGDDLEFQETYHIKNDSTFTKTRIWNETTTVSTGTYALSTLGPAINAEPVVAYIFFTHNQESEIIDNCGENLVEHLYFTIDFRLKNTWFTCDGPGMIYMKVL